MLINKQNTMDIVSIKLVTGEEIIGTLLNKTDHTLTLKKPIALTITQTGLSFIPYIISSDVQSETPEIEFNRNTVISISKTHKSFADKYIETTTGIKIPNNVGNSFNINH